MQTQTFISAIPVNVSEPPAVKPCAVDRKQTEPIKPHPTVLATCNVSLLEHMVRATHCMTWLPIFTSSNGDAPAYWDQESCITLSRRLSTTVNVVSESAARCASAAMTSNSPQSARVATARQALRRHEKKSGFLSIIHRLRYKLCQLLEGGSQEEIRWMRRARREQTHQTQPPSTPHR